MVNYQAYSSIWNELALKLPISMSKFVFSIVNEVGGVNWLAQDLFQTHIDAHWGIFRVVRCKSNELVPQ